MAGEWIQDRDYDEFWTLSTSASPPIYVHEVGDVVAESGYQDPPYDITFDDLADVFQEANASLPDKGGWIEMLTSGYQLSFPEWNATWRSRIWYRSFPASGREHFYNPPNFGVPIPEGAIGIEYEDQPYDPEDPWAWAKSTVTSLHLGATTEFEGQFEDGRVTSGEPLDWESDTFLILETGSVGGTLKTLPGLGYATVNWEEMLLDERIDLTPYGSGTALEEDFVFSLRTETPAVIVGGDPGFPNSTFTQYGWLIKRLRFEATLRPPKYRWVFSGEGRLKVNAGFGEWKFANPSPGENGGVGRLKVNVDGAWVRADQMNVLTDEGWKPS